MSLLTSLYKKQVNSHLNIMFNCGSSMTYFEFIELVGCSNIIHDKETEEELFKFMLKRLFADIQDSKHLISCNF